MATWIQSVSCECSECGADPCTPGCECTFSASDSGSGAFFHSYDVTGQFILAGTLRSIYNWESDGCYFRVYADGVVVEASGCRLDFSFDHNVHIPAGTTLIEVEMLVYDCASIGGGTFCDWSYTVQCV